MTSSGSVQAAHQGRGRSIGGTHAVVGGGIMSDLPISTDVLCSLLQWGPANEPNGCLKLLTSVHTLQQG